jgi:hypothetical protein
MNVRRQEGQLVLRCSPARIRWVFVDARQIAHKWLLSRVEERRVYLRQSCKNDAANADEINSKIDWKGFGRSYNERPEFMAVIM